MQIGITTIIAVVALFVGIIALWLVTEAMDKIKKRTRRIMEIQVRDPRAAPAP